MQTAFSFVLNKGNQGGNIQVEHVVATGITNNACSVEAWPESSTYEKVLFKDIVLSYNIKDTDILKITDIKRPRTESRPLPYWGFM